MSSFAKGVRRRAAVLAFGAALAYAALLAGPTMLAAQAPRPATVIMPEALAAAVVGDVARLWRVDSADVRLEWGAIPSAAVFSSSTRVRLTGKGGNGWLLVLFDAPEHSPVAVRVRAGVTDSVPVAARGLPADAELEAADIQMIAKVRWGPTPATRGVPTRGWTTRRPIIAGDELTASTVMPPQVVRAGDAVHVAWRRGSVLVALEGTALNSAGLGEAVRVRLAGRGGQRSGRATGPGEVQLDS